MIRLTPFHLPRHFADCSCNIVETPSWFFSSPLCPQVVVQYDKDLLEVWDEAKRLRCEWFNDYEKTASKPPMVIADLDVIQLDFRGQLWTPWNRDGKRRGLDGSLRLLGMEFDLFEVQELSEDDSCCFWITQRGLRELQLNFIKTT
jgi:hypothetical protein